MFRVESDTCPHCGSRDVSETTKPVCESNTTQDWREELQSFAQINELYLRGVPTSKLESFIESLIERGRLQGIEEAKKLILLKADEMNKEATVLTCVVLVNLAESLDKLKGE